MSMSKLATEELCTKSSTKSVTSASRAKGISALQKPKGEFDDYNQALVDWIDRDRHAHNVRPGSRESRGRAKNARHDTRRYCECALRSGLYPPIRPCGLLDCLGGHSDMVRSVRPWRARPHLRLWQ